MHRLASLVALAVISMAGPALADVPNDPCMGQSAGDACTTSMGDDGTCVDAGGFLTCEAGTSASTSSGGSTDDGDDDDGADDGGCSVGGPAPTQTFAWIGLALFAALRRRR